jgi:hypothetical protein
MARLSTSLTSLNLGDADVGSEALLLGAGKKTGYEVTTATANKNFVDFRTASTASSGWAHAAAFYLKVQHISASGCGVRGYVYSDAAASAHTGEICGVYGIAEQHGAATIAATGKLVGLRSRLTVPTGLTLSAGNYYGLLIETDMLSSIASCTNSAWIRTDDPSARGTFLKYFIDIVHGDVGTTAATNMVKSDLGDAATAAGLKIRINGTTYWIQLAAYSA